MINKIINILPIVQSLRQSEIQGKDKKQINTYICKYLCNVEMGNSNTGATEEEVEEIENEEKVEILPVRKIVGNITLPDSIENANKIWLKILKYMNLKTLLRLLQSCLIKQLCKSYKNKAFQRSVEMAIMTLKKDCIDELNHAYVTEFSHATIPTPFLVACEKGRINDVHTFINNMMHVNDVNGDNMINQKGKSTDGYEYTPLQIAAKNEQFDVVKLLLEKGAESEATTRGWNALHFIAAFNIKNVKTLQLLIQHHLHTTTSIIEYINHEDEVDGETPLDCVYIYNFSTIKDEIIHVIRNYGGKTNKYDENGVW